MLGAMARKTTSRPASRSALSQPAAETAGIDAIDTEDFDELPSEETAEPVAEPKLISATEEDAGLRLDHFLAERTPEVSRVRVQQLIEQGKVTVNGGAAKASRKLKGGEQIEISGPVEAPPLKAFAEDIPLEVLYEDRALAVVNKPAGMVVHAASGSVEDERNRGTLVNALLFRFQKLSGVGGELRPGIVHRLDKDTSGLMVVAKSDPSHRKLSEQFSRRQVRKTYLALVHNWPKAEQGSVNEPIGRDPRNRTRMSTQGVEARSALTHYKVVEQLLTPYGRFALLELRIESGRTHQIRVHMASIGHPVVGDTLYGAPQLLLPKTLARERRGNAMSARAEAKKARAHGPGAASLSLERNFLHAAGLRFAHPGDGRTLEFAAELPEELTSLLEKLRQSTETLP